ncbi:(deoxy)nucleoside triphosphate pyrophosphohydrolase [Dactylosporangium sp. CA-052675]|uniref:(deoxy)nucleoside triphosphate pyrophosphohydrolase n=1 Tax=Dactylosporangium sp. CA-052675 TaxID=3239927 RepID=UPI003D8DF0C3
MDLAPWLPVQTERLMPRIIVGAAIIANGRVLACERAQPPEMAGKWEFPGGKVDPGETEVQALVRECQEELGVDVAVGERVGDDIAMLNGTAILRVYVATLLDGAQPIPLEHSDLRWLGAGELDSVPWLPADAPIVHALEPLLPS